MIIHPILLMGVVILIIAVMIRIYTFSSVVYNRAKLLNSECIFQITERDDYHIKFRCITCGRVDTFYNLEDENG